MIDACLTSQTHYLDITGELDVFLAAQRGHADAQATEIVICPGVGFDVIPTDCLAAVLKEALPGRNPPRSGVRRTRTREPWHRTYDSGILPARPARRPGAAEPGDREVPLAHRRRPVDFAGGSAMTVAIAWGDLATALSRPAFPTSRPMPACHSGQRSPATRSTGHGPCSPGHRFRSCFAGSRTATPDPPR